MMEEMKNTKGMKYFIAASTYFNSYTIQTIDNYFKLMFKPLTNISTKLLNYIQIFYTLKATNHHRKVRGPFFLEIAKFRFLLHFIPLNAFQNNHLISTLPATLMYGYLTFVVVVGGVLHTFYFMHTYCGPCLSRKNNTGA